MRNITGKLSSLIATLLITIVFGGVTAIADTAISNNYNDIATTQTSRGYYTTDTKVKDGIYIAGIYLADNDKTLKVYTPSSATANLKKGMSNAASFWNQAAGKTVVVVTTSPAKADITYAQFSDSNLGGYAQTDYVLRVTAINSATFDTSKQSAWDGIIGHEMGHALGLGHADQGGANLTDVMAGVYGKRSAYDGLGSPSAYDKKAMGLVNTDFIATYNDGNEQLNGDLSADSYKLDGLGDFMAASIAYAKAHNYKYTDYLSLAEKIEAKLNAHKSFQSVMDVSATPEFLNLAESVAARLAVTSGYLPANTQLNKYMNMTIKVPVYFISDTKDAAGHTQILGISSFNTVYANNAQTMNPVVLPKFAGYKVQSKGSIGILDLLGNNSFQVKYMSDGSAKATPKNVTQYGSSRNGTLVYKMR